MDSMFNAWNRLDATATSFTSDSPTVGSTGRGVILWNLWTPRPLACTVVTNESDSRGKGNHRQRGHPTAATRVVTYILAVANIQLKAGTRSVAPKVLVASVGSYSQPMGTLCLVPEQIKDRGCQPRIVRMLAGPTHVARPVVYSPTPRRCSGPTEFAVVLRWPVAIFSTRLAFPNGNGAIASRKVYSLFNTGKLLNALMMSRKVQDRGVISRGTLSPQIASASVT